MRSRCSTWKASVASSCESSVLAGCVSCPLRSSCSARSRRAERAALRLQRDCWQARDLVVQFRVGRKFMTKAERSSLRPVPNEGPEKVTRRARREGARTGGFCFFALGGRSRPFPIRIGSRKVSNGGGFAWTCSRRIWRTAASPSLRPGKAAAMSKLCAKLCEMGNGRERPPKAKKRNLPFLLPP